METTQNPSFFPKPLQILSGSSLKLIACVLMLVDHLGAIILYRLPSCTTVVLTLFGKNYTIYNIARGFGRIPFPIYCFLLVEGFTHTRNRLKYARNLLLFALVSEIPWNLAFGKSLHYSRQNVYFTLFFGFVTMCLVEYFEDKKLLQLLVLFGMLFVTVKFNADYSYRGYIFIMIMYWLRNQRGAQALIGSAWLKYEWVAGFAFIPINMYNGKRGFIKSKVAKYAFYAYYPVHIMILFLIRYHLWGLR